MSDFVKWNDLSTGQRIKFVRKSKKLTQAELAEMIKRTESSIRKYEKGIVDIPISVLKAIAKSLEIKTIDLIEED